MTTTTTTPATTPLAAPSTTRVDWGDVLQKLGALAGLLLAFGLFSILEPKAFFNFDNVELILLQTAIVATAALGMTMIIISSGIDLSIGSQIALVTVVTAQLLQWHVPLLLAVLCGILTGVLCGFVIGILITGSKLVPFIVTLGAYATIRGMARWLASDTTIYLDDTARQMGWLGGLLHRLPENHRWMLAPPGVWLTFLLALLVAGLLQYTRFGRHIFAIGSNEQTARLCGVNVSLTKVMVYALAGALTGIAGVMEFGRITVGDSTTAMGRELDVIAAVVIGGGSLSGGQGSIFGTLIGALLMTVIANGCQTHNWPNYIQLIVTGIIIVAAAAIDRWRQSRAV